MSPKVQGGKKGGGVVKAIWTLSQLKYISPLIAFSYWTIYKVVGSKAAALPGLLKKQERKQYPDAFFSNPFFLQKISFLLFLYRG